jgi:acetyl esterase/lipase
MSTYNLEKPIEGLLAALASAPALNTMAPADARAMIDSVQSEPVPMPDVEVSVVSVPASVGDVQLQLIRPRGVQGSLPVVLYLHGGGWILGSFISHGRLARELAVGANAVVAFVEYALAPQARYPVQIEQCYAAAKWLVAHAAEYGIDSSRLAVAGDSAGGNMAAVLAILAKQRGDLHIVQQSLYYPMTDTGHDTESDRQFRDGPYGTAAVMDWFYDAYLDESVDRTAITVSPLQATPADLEGLPPALVIVDENDVLRDQGEAYANKLRDAGVLVTSVRFNGTMHDFMMLNALRDTESTRAAIGLAAATLRRAFDSVSVA